MSREKAIELVRKNQKRLSWLSKNLDKPSELWGSRLYLLEQDTRRLFALLKHPPADAEAGEFVKEFQQELVENKMRMGFAIWTKTNKACALLEAAQQRAEGLEAEKKGLKNKVKKLEQDVKMAYGAFLK